MNSLTNEQLLKIANEYGVVLSDSKTIVEFVIENDFLKMKSEELNPIFVDYESLIVKFKNQFKKKGLKKEPLATAIGSKCETVIDATCGMAKDTCYFISMGKKVIAYERNPIVVLLLKQNLNIAQRKRRLNIPLTIINGECEEFGENAVVYFDPMYEETNKKALPQKNMRIFRSLVGVDDDAMEFAMKLKASSSRLIIKRPIKSAPLIERPSFSTKGKSTRYDVYL